MARIENDPNYTSPTFPRATEASDIFRKEDIQNVAAALSTHLHDGTAHGLPIVVTNAMLADNSVTGAKIADATITAIDIAPNAIVGGNIAPNTVLGANIANETITSANIQNGTIATADLAINAVQNQVGAYAAVPAFSSSTTGSYLATPIAVTIATTGRPLRIQGQTTLSCTTVGQRVLVAIMENAVVQQIVAMFDNPGANYNTQVAWTIYTQPAAGTYTYCVYVELVNAGTLAISGSVQSALYVTEQLR